MTKSLTENAWVYTDKGIEKVHWCNVHGVDELVTPKGKVLAPVPSYDEYNELIDKIEQLEKQLEIATKALKEYANEENWRTATTIINTDYFEYECSMYGLKDSGFEEAQKALKEMEGVE